jgi:hypothetical protein
MNIKIIGVIIVLALLGGFVVWQTSRDTVAPVATTTPTNTIATTTPEAPTPSATGPVTLALGQRGTRYGISVIPQKVSDSRCPKDVQCIWAGKVEVIAQIVSAMGTSTNTFEIGTTITTEGESVTLLDVAPYPNAGVARNPSEYRITFEITKRTDL